MTGRDLLHEIVSAIVEVDERDVSELPPLYDSVEPDALQSLVESGVERVEFRHAGYRVVIMCGEVTVHSLSEG
jgi:hypothetical protein